MKLDSDIMVNPIVKISFSLFMSFHGSEQGFTNKNLCFISLLSPLLIMLKGLRGLESELFSHNISHAPPHARVIIGLVQDARLAKNVFSH